jgi:hypothetical protein
MEKLIKRKEKVFEKFPNYYRFTELNLLKKNEKNNENIISNSQDFLINYKFSHGNEKLLNTVPEYLADFSTDLKYVGKEKIEKEEKDEKEIEKSVDSDDSDEEVEKKIIETDDKNIEKYESSDIDEEFSVYEESEDSGEFSS